MTTELAVGFDDLGVLAEEKGQLIEVSSGGAVAQGDLTTHVHDQGHDDHQ